MAIYQRPDFCGSLADAQTFYTASYNAYMLALKGTSTTNGRQYTPQLIEKMGDEVSYWSAQVLRLGGQIQPVAPDIQEIYASMQDVTGDGGTVNGGTGGFFAR